MDSDLDLASVSAIKNTEARENSVSELVTIPVTAPESTVDEDNLPISKMVKNCVCENKENDIAHALATGHEEIVITHNSNTDKTSGNVDNTEVDVNPTIDFAKIRKEMRK